MSKMEENYRASKCCSDEHIKRDLDFLETREHEDRDKTKTLLFCLSRLFAVDFSLQDTLVHHCLCATSKNLTMALT